MYKKKLTIIGVILLLEFAVIYLISNPPLGNKELEKIADSAAKTGKIGRAVRFYGYALEKDPNNAELYYKRALEYEKLGMNGNAELDLNEAVAIEPNNAKYRIERLNDKFSYDNQDTEEIKEIIKLKIKTEEECLKLINHFRKERSTIEAVTIYGETSLPVNVKIEEEEKLEENIINIYKSINKNSKELKQKVIEYKLIKYKRIVEEFSRTAKLSIENKSKKEKIKEECYSIAENNKENFIVYNLIADVFNYYDNEKIIFLKKMVKENPKYGDGYQKIADIETEKAIEYYTKAIRAGNNSYNLRADIFKQRGKYKEAIADYTNMMKNNPFKGDYSYRGECYTSRSNYWYAWMDKLTKKY